MRRITGHSMLGSRSIVAAAGCWILALSPAGVASLLAQDADPERIEALAGAWTLEAKQDENTFELQLEIGEYEGAAQAALQSSFGPEPTLIDSIRNGEEDGVELAFDANFGGASLRILINARLEGEQLVGTFGDELGFLNAGFTGARSTEPADILERARAAAAAAEESDEEKPRRRRFGSNVTETFFAEDRIEVLYGRLELETPDHEAFVATEPGEIFLYPSSRTIRLLTDLDLLFGDQRVAAHNLAPNYPGVYALWLKRTEDGWNLLFNLQGDHWGTQYESKTDVLEVPLVVGTAENGPEELLFEVTNEGDGGAFRITWGDVVLEASFTTASPAE